MKNTFSLLTLVLFFANCTSVSTDDLTIPAPASITYTANVKAIIDQSCATSGCHNATGNSGSLILEDFTQVRNAIQSRNALGRMESTSNPMPASGNLPSTSIQIIKNWRDQGYIE
jgi:hypothetical protein